MCRVARSYRSTLVTLLLIALLLAMSAIPAIAQDTGIAAAPSSAQAVGSGTYQNPLRAVIPAGGVVESCADPSIIRGQTPGDSNWYIFCTTDPLNSNDKTGINFNFHLIPMLRSPDLVNWTYMGDAFSAKPAWADPNAGLWAPDIHYFNGQYYLYYTASQTVLPGGGSAIGVATSVSPLGPWADSGAPVVEPHAPPCCAGDKRWVFDPALVTDDSGQTWIFYGSYFGGISARKLSADGLHSDPTSQVQITTANKYEGAFVVKRGGFYYLFASATNCCNGPLTGYSVFVGRSSNVTGPYVDQQGVPLLDNLSEGRIGGTPALTMNGNRFVGTGHNAVFTDFSGQDWTVYHAVDQTDPYFETGFTKRPLMMDPLDWVNGWPQVRAGNWASDRPIQAPAAQPGTKTNYKPQPPTALKVGSELAAYSDEFDGSALGPQWSWVRAPDAATFSVGGGLFSFDTQAADIYVDSNNASVLTESAPADNYVVETKVRIEDLPAGCCHNYVQAGLVIYANDDNFVKLATVSIWETRQTEFAKEVSPVPDGYPRYGNTVVGPPGEWTWLRIVVSRDLDVGRESYQAYTSRDGQTWVRGGVWTHQLGATAKIGLVSMGGSGFTGQFDYVRVYRVNNQFLNR